MSQRQTVIPSQLYHSNLNSNSTDMVTPLLTLQSGWAPRPDQSTRSTLQLFLEHLDKHIEQVIRIHKEMLEFRARITELLRNREPEVTAGDQGEWVPQDGTVGLQAVINDEQLTFVNEPPPFYGRLLDIEFNQTEPIEVTSTLQESADLVSQPSQDLFRYGTSSYEAPAGDFPSHHDTFPERLDASNSSANLDEQLPLTIVQVIRERVQCNWPGCSRIVNKDNLTRHINEMHRRRIRVICNRCGKGYTRRYMMTSHNCRAGHRDG
ncbi:hypothetical protein EDD22DRAFT_887308 [Suillus occidentalis]|nr:hypothetical protein EDD22DRAFT_887308 [Suillus occidentalis]